jgi:UrcA family protein
MSHRTRFSTTVLAAPIVMALLWLAPVYTRAEQHPAPATVSRVADVRLSDLNLSTPEGMREARERLRTEAQSVCAQPARSRGLAVQPSFAACVDSTMAAQLKLIRDLRQQHQIVRTYETRAASVSLADLDLSTPEGARVARERLEAVARRICGELASSRDLTYEPSYTTCVQDSLARVQAQVDVLATAGNARAARRDEPQGEM